MTVFTCPHGFGVCATCGPPSGKRSDLHRRLSGVLLDETLGALTALEHQTRAAEGQHLSAGGHFWMTGPAMSIGLPFDVQQELDKAEEEIIQEAMARGPVKIADDVGEGWFV